MVAKQSIGTYRDNFINAFECFQLNNCDHILKRSFIRNTGLQINLFLYKIEAVTGYVRVITD